MAEMKTLNGYEIVDEWAREQIGYINDATNAPTDIKYFDIDGNGVISLKAKYRGCPPDTAYPYAVSDNGASKEGSEIYQLPKRVVLPETINGVAVTAFVAGMFYHNYVVEEIVFPNTITAIPARFARDAHCLKAIKNTEHIKTIAERAFMNSHIYEAFFPNLETMEGLAFNQCVYLRTADIGKVQAVPTACFANCPRLETVFGGENVKTIGEQSFAYTWALKSIPFLSLLKVESFAKKAFFISRLQFDWSKYPSGAFGELVTPAADNTTDYWSKIIGNRYYDPCENRLGSWFTQMHPLWKDEPLMNVQDKTWESGCATFAAIHIHSALSGKTYATPFEFEAELAGKTTADGTPLLDLDLSAGGDAVVAMFEGLGYEVETHYDLLDEDDFQALLDALAEGAYAYIVVSSANSVNYGHVVVGYGVNEIGEVMMTDSAPFDYKVGVYDDRCTYQMPLQNTTGPDSNIIIVRKP